MTKLKKLLALALAGVLALCVLTGCGGSSSGSDKASKDSEEAAAVLAAFNFKRPANDPLKNDLGDVAERLLNSFTTKAVDDGKALVYRSKGSVTLPDGYKTFAAFKNYGESGYSLPERDTYEFYMNNDSLYNYIGIIGKAMDQGKIGIATRTINGELYFVAIVEADAYV